VLGNAGRNRLVTGASKPFLCICLEKRTPGSQISALQALLYLCHNN